MFVKFATLAANMVLRVSCLIVQSQIFFSFEIPRTFFAFEMKIKMSFVMEGSFFNTFAPHSTQFLSGVDDNGGADSLADLSSS